MDDLVSEILISWGFPEFCSPFAENGIDFEAFTLLENDVIKELIPKVGPRLKFLKKYKEYQHTNSKKETVKEQESDSSSSPSFSEENEGRSNSATSLASTVTLSSDFELDLDNANDMLSYSPSATDQQIYCSSNPLQSDADLSIIIVPTNHESDTHFSVPPTTEVVKEEFEKFLRLSSEWSIIQRNVNSINEYTRGKISKVALDFLIPKYPSKKIPHKAFIDLAEVISKIFPKESPHIYFIPYKPETESSPALLAGGKLFSKYNNYKRLINTLDGDKSKSNKRLKTDKQERQGASCSNAFLTNKEEEVANEYLKHNAGPENEVLIYWSTSFQIRRRVLQTTDIHSYFSTYRALEQSFGYNLLLQDFHKIHPSTCNEIYNTWAALSDAILVYATKRHIISEDFYNNCDKEVVAIKYLPLLFSTSTVRQGKKHWRPSKAEMQESFLLQINNIGLLDEKIENRKQTLRTKNETLQPFMVLVEDVNNSASYVVVNNTIYILESPLKCLDVCFKIFFALDCKYPVECQQVWTFIQTFVYKIKGDKRFAGLNVITNEINNILNDKRT